VIRIQYRDGRGVLRTVLQAATRAGFAVEDLSTEPAGRGQGDSAPSDSHRPSLVEVTMHVHGKGLVNELAATLAEIDGVSAVVAGDVNLVTE
jgi:putative Mg2+ transporter-C (MgtC) family protein